MTKEYVFYVMLDGPVYGIRDGSVHTDADPSEEAWIAHLDDMARDHVESYMDIDEWEEENGCEIELDSRAEAWDPERHPQRVNGVGHYAEILDNMKQDEKGRWYIEK